MEEKNIIIAIITISVFVLGVSIGTLYVQHSLEYGRCVIPIPYFIPIFASTGLIIGASVYYFISSKVESCKKLEERKIKTILKILDNDERAVLEELISRDEVLQSEISRKIGKVNAHRAIKKLLMKDVIEKIKYGKTHKIRLKCGENE